MARRTSWLLLAIVRWLLTAILISIGPSGAVNVSADKQRPGDTTQISRSTGTDTTNAMFKAYPGYNPDPCYRYPDKDAADLCAQWRAALAAEASANEARKANNVALWAAILNGLSLVGVCAALFLSIQSNRIARETAKQQLRAYITVDNVGFHGLSKSDEKPSYTLMNVNCGQTPALHCHGYVQAYFETADHSATLASNDTVLAFPPYAIGPNTKSGAYYRHLQVTPEQRGRFLEKRLFLYVTNTVIYSDIFGKQYRLDQVYRSRSIADGAAMDPLIDTTVDI